jgi:hypothetical protein
MTHSLPAHLAEAIRRRIAALRAASLVDETYLDASPRLRGYPLAREQRVESRDLT